MSIVYVAGKSGGHIIPALTLAEKSTYAGHPSHIIIHDLPLDRLLCSKANFLDRMLMLSLRPGNIRQVWMYPWYMYDLIRSIMQCYQFLRSCHATQLVSMGGYISLPAVIAARLYGIPVIMYELNVVPGRAVQWLAPYVHELRYCFTAAHDYFLSMPHAHHVAYPLKYTYDELRPLAVARSHAGIPREKYVVLVIGGSQGSQKLNHMFCQWISELSISQRERLFVVHQTGTYDAMMSVQEKYQSYGVQADVRVFFENLSVYYCAANSVVTRAGSGALHELLFFKRPAVIVPLETATNSHQVDNAQAFVAEHPHTYYLVRQHQQELLGSVMERLLAEK